MNCDRCRAEIGPNPDDPGHRLGGHWSISLFTQRVEDEEGDSFDNQSWDEYLLCMPCHQVVSKVVTEALGPEEGQ